MLNNQEIKQLILETEKHFSGESPSMFDVNELMNDEFDVDRFRFYGEAYSAKKLEKQSTTPHPSQSEIAKMKDEYITLSQTSTTNALVAMELARVNEKLIDHINSLVSKSKSVIARWDSPDWKDGTHTADYIHALRKAVEDVTDQLPKFAELQKQVPNGWKLMPMEPTEEMEFEGNNVADNLAVQINGQAYVHDTGTAKDVYKSMLAAAPDTPNTEEMDGKK